MSEETPLDESCKAVIIEVPLSLELINPLSHTSLELNCSLYLFAIFHSLGYSLLKTMDCCVITNSNDDLDVVDILMQELQGNVSKCSRSLCSKWYSHSFECYYFYLEDMPKSIVLSSLPHYSIGYSKAFDKLKGALCIIVVFTFSYLHFSNIYA